MRASRASSRFAMMLSDIARLAPCETTPVLGPLLLRRGGEAQVATISEDGRSLKKRLRADER